MGQTWRHTSFSASWRRGAALRMSPAHQPQAESTKDGAKQANTEPGKGAEQHKLGLLKSINKLRWRMTLRSPCPLWAPSSAGDGIGQTLLKGGSCMSRTSEAFSKPDPAISPGCVLEGVQDAKQPHPLLAPASPDPQDPGLVSDSNTPGLHHLNHDREQRMRLLCLDKTFHFRHLLALAAQSTTAGRRTRCSWAPCC